MDDPYVQILKACAPEGMEVIFDREYDADRRSIELKWMNGGEHQRWYLYVEREIIDFRWNSKKRRSTINLLYPDAVERIKKVLEFLHQSKGPAVDAQIHQKVEDFFEVW